MIDANKIINIINIVYPIRIKCLFKKEDGWDGRI
tara:strand:- start:4 stop:105 length:102 start_codon:yes stop_codon:yes gene_type:complete